MSGHELDTQERLLKKQFSTTIEALGKEWILQRTDRKRHYEQRHEASKEMYTQRLKTIDDLNEMCEILELSRQEFLKQQRNGKFGVTDEQILQYN